MATPTPPAVDERALIDFADSPGTRGLALAGSIIRGEANPWSDIDIFRYVTGTGIPPALPPRWIGERLVRVSTITMEYAWTELERPEIAIWAVLPLRSMRILIDRDGDIARLSARARDFQWNDIAGGARTWASLRLAKDAENVLKLRAAIETVDESSILNAHLNLAAHCADAVAVARGVLIPTENRFHDVVRKAAGPEWTRRQRAAYGLNGEDAVARARATCDLYAFTLSLLGVDGDDRAVAERALKALR